MGLALICQWSWRGWLTPHSETKKPSKQWPELPPSWPMGTSQRWSSSPISSNHTLICQNPRRRPYSTLIAWWMWLRILSLIQGGRNSGLSCFQKVLTFISFFFSFLLPPRLRPTELNLDPNPLKKKKKKKKKVSRIFSWNTSKRILFLKRKKRKKIRTFPLSKFGKAISFPYLSFRIPWKS